MVQPAGLEPATSSFAGRRSNPTELWLRNVLAHCIIFLRKSNLFSWDLATPRHSIEIETFLIHHGMGDIVLLFPFSEESSFVDDSEFYELIEILGRKFLLWECFLILEISGTSLVREIESGFLILISRIDNHSPFLPFRELTSRCLFFDDAGFETVGIGHRGSDRYRKQIHSGISPLCLCDCSCVLMIIMERGNGFEPSHPRVEALVHSLFYVTPA